MRGASVKLGREFPVVYNGCDFDSYAPSFEPGAYVAFLGRIENLDLQPMQSAARIIVNGRTGSVVMNQSVAIDTCASVRPPDVITGAGHGARCHLLQGARR